jgi:hypothetical protein
LNEDIEMHALRRFAALALVALAACSGSDSPGTGPDGPGVPGSIQSASTVGLTAQAGLALADSVAVVVHDSDGVVVPGVVVGFQVTSGGGSVSPVNATTDSHGVARTRWVLGGEIRTPQTLQASARADLATTITATGTLSPSATVTKSGDGATGPAGSTFPLTVQVQQNGVPVSGLTVGWQTLTGQGTGGTANGTNYTDVLGRAILLYVPASAGQPQVKGIPQGLQEQFFTLNVTAAAPAQFFFSPSSGFYLPGTTVTGGVFLRDTFGNPVSGVPVQISVTGGSAPSQVTTTASGGAQVLWTLPTQPGTYTLTATGAGLTTTGTATVSGAPAPVAHIAITPSDRTLDVTSVAPTTVTLQDQFFNPTPIAGVQVQISVDGGTAPATVTTGADGTATFNWTMPTSTTPSSVHLTATAAGFTANAQVSLTSGPAVSIGTLPSTQTAAPNQEVTFTHDLRDQYGNRVVNRAAGCGPIVWSVPAPATWRQLVGSLSSYIAVSSPQSVTLTVSCGPLTGTGQLVIVP